jgi:hypothetical protein
VLVHRLAAFFRNQGAELDASAQRIADTDEVDLREQGLDEPCGNAFLDVDALDRTAILPRIGERSPDDPSRRARDVRVRRDNRWMLAAQAQHHRSRPPGRRGHDALSGFGRPGDEHLCHLVVETSRSVSSGSRERR